MNDLDRTDYDVNEIVEDIRLSQARKEMLITQIVGTTVIILSVAIAYILGKGDPTGYTFIMGYPVWYVVSVGVCFCGTIFALIFATKLISPCSLEAKNEEVKEDEF